MTCFDARLEYRSASPQCGHRSLRRPRWWVFVPCSISSQYLGRALFLAFRPAICLLNVCLQSDALLIPLLLFVWAGISGAG